MRNFIIIIFFLLNVNGFNVKYPINICRRNCLNKISKASLIYTIFGKYKKADAKESRDIDNKIEENLNIISNEPILLTSIENNIYFYSTINQESAFELEKKIIIMNKIAIENNITDIPINLHIQSYGGSLHHTLYLIDLIKNLETPVYTYIDGFAASAATLLSCSGKKRFITKNSIMLIHQLSSGFEGKYNEIHDENENINNLMGFIIQFYLENTNIKIDELKALLKRDLWLDSSKCLSIGLVDEII